MLMIPPRHINNPPGLSANHPVDGSNQPGAALDWMITQKEQQLWKGAGMRYQPNRIETINNILAGIQEGMPVYDLISQKLGTVKYIHFPSDTHQDVSDIDDPNVQNAPEPVQARLLEVGFMRIDRGLLRKDFYVPADQIEGVVDHEVFLNMLKEELVTL